jgi:nucleobase:cation symporter-1, NCS1 family
VAVLPVLPGFVRAAGTPGGQVANPTLLDALYTYAWFVTFASSAILYLALSWGRLDPLHAVIPDDRHR